jgi:hypothetical protein
VNKKLHLMQAKWLQPAGQAQLVPQICPGLYPLWSLKAQPRHQATQSSSAQHGLSKPCHCMTLHNYVGTYRACSTGEDLNRVMHAACHALLTMQRIQPPCIADDAVTAWQCHDQIFEEYQLAVPALSAGGPRTVSAGSTSLPGLSGNTVLCTATGYVTRTGYGLQQRIISWCDKSECCTSQRLTMMKHVCALAGQYCQLWRWCENRVRPSENRNRQPC